MKRHTMPRLYIFKISYIFLLFIIASGCENNENTDAQKGEEKDSLRILNEFISREGNPSDRIRRAQILYDRNQFEAALKDVNTALQSDSSQYKWYILKSDIEMEYFRSMESIRTLEKALKKWPENTELRQNLSEAYLIVKQYKEAVENTEEILKINPLSSDAYSLLGVIAREQEDTVQAIKYFQEAIQLNADRLESWVELANLQTGRNNSLAAEYYKSALQIAPDNKSLLHSYALFLQEIDDLEEAKGTYDKIIAIAPSYENAYFNKGLLLMDQDSFSLATEEFNSLIRINQHNAKHYFYRGICYEMTRNFENALSDYTEAKSLDANLPNIDKAISSVRKKIK